MSALTSANIVFLSEIGSYSGSSYIRVTGFVTAVNYSQRVCALSDDNYTLEIDMALIDTSVIKLGTQIQFIGDLQVT